MFCFQCYFASMFLKYFTIVLFLLPAISYGQLYINCAPVDTASLLSFKQKVALTPTPDQSVMTMRVFQREVKPFFCNIEHKMNRTSKVPVYFRLGSKDYVDRMEGK